MKNTKCNRCEDFKKEITIDKVIEFKGEITDDIVPNNAYLFFENGILTDCKNEIINPISKGRFDNFCFYSYEDLDKY